MRRILTARFVVGLALLSCAAGLAQELQLVDSGEEKAVRRVWLSGSSRRVLANEPEFVSEKPLWFDLELGNGKNRFIAAAADESKGTGTGYDTLYVDANNNGDLTDDPPLKALKNEAANQYETVVEFPPVAVRVLYHDGSERNLKVKIDLEGYRNGDNSNWSVNYSLEQHLEGLVDFDGKKRLVGIYDASGQGRISGEANGCFDDFGVDRLRIDMDGEGKLDPEKKDFPLSKVIACDGKLWQVEIDSAGRKFRVRPSKLPAGQLELRASFDPSAHMESSSLQLFCGLGYAFRCDLSKQKATSIPAGRYTVEDGTVTLADGKGAKWSAKFAYPKTVRVDADKTVPLAIGLPLKLQPVVASTVVAGGRATVAHKLTGSAGETYSSLTCNDEQLAPSVVITDAEGIKILEGKMTFG